MKYEGTICSRLHYGTAQQPSFLLVWMYNFAITIYFLQVLVSFLFEISFLMQVHPKQSSRVTKTQRFTECEIIKKQKHYDGERTSICFFF